MPPRAKASAVPRGSLASDAAPVKSQPSDKASAPAAKARAAKPVDQPPAESREAARPAMRSGIRAGFVQAKMKATASQTKTAPRPMAKARSTAGSVARSSAASKSVAAKASKESTAVEKTPGRNRAGRPEVTAKQVSEPTNKKTPKLKTAAAPKAAVQTERKAKMPMKKNAADAAQSGPAKTAKSATPTKTAATRHVAAAFVAARKKMTPAVKSAPASGNDVDALKGVVEVADSNAKKTADEQVSASAAPTVEAASAPHAQHSVPGGRPANAERIAPRPAKPAGKAPSFKTNEFIVYPAHGVGEITAIEEQEVAGYKLELFVISFVKDKMILKVPLPKAASVGMRKLADSAVMKRALDTLTGRARIKRTMWSRRAQEYEAKINSGDLVSIAEVVRDLYRSDAQPEQSYSERQLYEAALDRMARELAAVEKLTDTEALKLIDAQLQKGPRRSKADAEAEDAGETDEDEGGIGEAA